MGRKAYSGGAIVSISTCRYWHPFGTSVTAYALEMGKIPCSSLVRAAEFYVCGGLPSTRNIGTVLSGACTAAGSLRYLQKQMCDVRHEVCFWKPYRSSIVLKFQQQKRLRQDAVITRAPSSVPGNVSGCYSTRPSDSRNQEWVYTSSGDCT